MNRINIWQETLPVRFGNIDSSDRVTLAAVFDFFQEAAISHAEHLGVGREAMARTGQVWVLSRMSVLILRRPRWTETLTLRSWPRGAEKLFALRDYDLRDTEGAPLVLGRSGWLVLDREKRRPLRSQSFIEGLPRNEGLDALAGLPPGLEARNGLSLMGERRAVYSDIDCNGHVNNARYVQWIQDSLAPGHLIQARGMRLDINYLREVMGGDSIQLWAAPLPPEAAKAGESGLEPWQSLTALEGRYADDRPAFRAELRTR